MLCIARYIKQLESNINLNRCSSKSRTSSISGKGDVADDDSDSEDDLKPATVSKGNLANIVSVNA